MGQSFSFRPLIVLLGFPMLFSCMGIDSGEEIKVTEGYDWSLPDHVQPTPFTGWARSEGYREQWEELYPSQGGPDEIFYHRVIGFNWAEVNPGRGVFDWSLIDSVVQQIEKEPNSCFSLLPGIWSKKSLRGGLQKYPYGGWHDLTAVTTYGTHFRQFRYPMIPEWVNVEYLSTGLAAAWDPGAENEYFEALADFINTLAERYRNHPRFGWVHCTFLDYAWGEGCFRAPRNADEGEKQAYVAYAIEKTELTPENLEHYMKTLVDIFADAFRGKEGRVVWTSVETELGPLKAYGGTEYESAKERGWQYAMDKGFGGRDGQVEIWMRYLTKGYGNVIDDNGYLVMNDDYGPIRNGVVWYTENENWTQYFVPHDSVLFYIYKARAFRLLQMRRNWDWGGIQKALEFPELGRYVQLSLGKTISSSLDAWCWPRESYVLQEDSVVPVKNFERWLYQRDVAEGGMTRVAGKTDISGFHQTVNPYDYEYEARSTDVRSGSNSMYFDIDERWSGERMACKLFVTFHDNSTARWQVEYHAKRKVTRSEIFSQDNSGKIQTAVFTVPCIRTTGELEENMDLKIKTLNDEDVTVLFVRAVKNNKNDE